MNLKEAKNICKEFIKENRKRPIILHEAIEAILQELENKDKDIENWEKIYNFDEAQILELNNKICDLEFELENKEREV